MPFGLGGKKEEATFRTEITDNDELGEVKKIADRLDPDERVLLVARQSRVMPGGSIATPNTIFATDKRLLIRDPSALGLRQSVEDIGYDRITSARLEKGVFTSKVIIRAPGLSTLEQKKFNLMAFRGGSDEGEIEAIPKDKAEKLVEIIKKGMDAARSAARTPAQSSSSIVDELAKLAKLKAEGIITEAEFQTMKSDLVSKKG